MKNSYLFIGTTSCSVINNVNDELDSQLTQKDEVENEYNQYYS